MVMETIGGVAVEVDDVPASEVFRRVSDLSAVVDPALYEVDGATEADADWYLKVGGTATRMSTMARRRLLESAWPTNPSDLKTPTTLLMQRVMQTLAEPNLITNGAMEVSQENGTTPGTTDAYYPVDEWRLRFAPTSTEAASVQQIVSNSGNSVRATMTAIGGAPTHLKIRQTLEGSAIKPLKWGNASARYAKCGFDFKTSIAGTYYFVISVAAYEAIPFTVSATEAGSGNFFRKYVRFSPQTGAVSSNPGVGYLALTLDASSVFYGTLNATCEVRNVDLYADDYGIDRPFPRKTYPEYLRECQRYYWKLIGNGVDNWEDLLNGGTCDATTYARYRVQFPVAMPYAPSLQHSGAGTFANLSSTGSSQVSTLSAANSSQQGIMIHAYSSGLSSNMSTTLRKFTNAAAYLAFSGRL